MSSNDEAQRKLLKPSPTEDEVIAALRTSYCATDEDSEKRVTILKELESYDDKNYLVEIGRTRYLAKVHNGVESDDYVRALEAQERRKDGGGSGGGGDDGGGGGEDDGGGGDHAHAPTSVIDLQNAIFSFLSDPRHKVTTSAPVHARNHPDRNDPTASASSSSAVGDAGGGGDEEGAPSPVSIHSLPVVSAPHSPRRLVVRLLTWVPGRTLSSLRTFPIETLASAGRYLGRLRLALDELGEDAVRAATRYHAWDGRETHDLEKFVGCIEDEGRRGLVQSLIDVFKNVFGGKDGGAARDFPRGILMGDYNDAIILVDEELRISGVIDFGDSVYSWRVLDISVAMAYAMISTYGKSGRALSAAAAMLRGFHSVCPLMPAEREHLHLLVASRLACSVTLGAYSYKQNPENKYLLFHAEPAWRTLELIWGRGGTGGSVAEAIGRLFNAACEKSGLVGSASNDDDTVIDCSDIAIPDPGVLDLLASVRERRSSSPSLDRPAGPPAKKQKTNDSSEAAYGLPVITFVTGNKRKLEEVKRILSTSPSQKDSRSSSDSNRLPFSITNRKIDLPELQGEPDDIAREKCALAASEVGGPVITEDTSLCFSALGDLPGPYIKWFLDKCGHSGLNDMIRFSEDKSGYAQTVVAFSPGPGGDVVVFNGRTRGKIVPPRGKLEFGWDPVFEPDEGGGQTYAEMSKEGKDAISHRSRAFAQLRDYFVKEEEKIKARF